MPAPTELPPLEELHRLFEYRDGFLYWRIRRGRAKAGRKVDCVNKEGYFVVGLRYKKCLVHRIVWAMHGRDPVRVIDHINGDRKDNRIENLRAANWTINSRNACIRKSSSSGIKGVSWSKSQNKWIGQVWHEKKLYRAGAFGDKQECAAAVRALRESLHGEFANHG